MIRPTDGELLMRFTQRRDEEAFRLLVERHAPLVQTVCDRVLHNHQDVEDAFQATFLVLAKNARSIRCRDSVASWLFKVAHRTALHAAMQNKYHPSPVSSVQLEQKVRLRDSDDRVSSHMLSQLERRETFERLAAELNRLPDRYRKPLVLFYLEGKSRRVAAEELDCTDAALKARLARGRQLLRGRLLRCGISLSLAFVVLELGTETMEAASVTALIEPTVKACVQYTMAGKVGPACSANSVSLAEGFQPMSTFTLTKTTVAAGLLAAAGLLTLAVVGSQHLAAQSDRGRAGVSENVVETTAEVSEAQQTAPQAQLLAQFGPARDTERPAGGGAGIQTGNLPNSATPDRGVTIDLKEHSPAEQSILAALEQHTTVEFIDTPLRDVIDYIADSHRISIRFETTALQEEGITTDEPVNLVLTGAKLESALNIILHDEVGGLTYIVEDEILKITTQTAAEAKPETRVYPVQNLVEAGFEEESLQEIVANDTGTELANVHTLPGFLVITQSQPEHRRTAKLLNQLHRAAELIQR